MQVVREHDGDADPDDCLLHGCVADGAHDIFVCGLSPLDHVAVAELEDMNAGRSHLAGDDHLAALGVGIYHESNDGVAPEYN